MARKISVVCDAPGNDGHDAGEHEADGIARIGYNGQWRELDVCETGADVVRDIMADLMARGHSYGSAGGRPATTGSTRGVAGGAATKRNAEIRAWARRQGIEVPKNGRISQPLVDKYDMAHAGDAVKV